MFFCVFTYKKKKCIFWDLHPGTQCLLPFRLSLKGHCLPLVNKSIYQNRLCEGFMICTIIIIITIVIVIMILILFLFLFLFFLFFFQIYKKDVILFAFF